MESFLIKVNDRNSKVEPVITIAASTIVANLKLANLESKKDEKFEIHLMVRHISSSGFKISVFCVLMGFFLLPILSFTTSTKNTHGSDDRDIDLSDLKEVAIQETNKTREDEKLRKSDINEQKMVAARTHGKTF
ncbi:hypothetical protein Hdeb2414_s0002g00053791 [Helianthus debilis subsp. tardiflorus]